MYHLLVNKFYICKIITLPSNDSNNGNYSNIMFHDSFIMSLTKHIEIF